MKAHGAGIEVVWNGPPEESGSNANADAPPCCESGSTSVLLRAQDMATAAGHTFQLKSNTLTPNRVEELTDVSCEDDAEDEDEGYSGGRSHCDDSAPVSFESEGAGTFGNGSAAQPKDDRRVARQRIRIRGYRPLDELRSFAKVLITSLNKEFITPRLDYTTPPPACLSEGLGDAHIMGNTLYSQMKVWLSDPNDECARDMAAYFKAATPRYNPNSPAPPYFSRSSPHFVISLTLLSRSKANLVCPTERTGTTSNSL
jgi:hypothetical protein